MNKKQEKAVVIIGLALVMILYVGIITRPKENVKLVDRTATVTYSKLNVRDEDSKIIGELHNGDHVTLTGREKFDLTFTWYEIKSDSESGVAWIADVGISLE